MENVYSIDKKKQWQLEKMVAYFFTYAFIGWIIEEVLFLVLYKELVYRGFLYLPILPIYGFGAVLVTILFPDKDYEIISIFVIGGLICTFIEYITSYVLEKFLNLSLWDYSSSIYNLNGRVSLLSSIMFALACVLVVKILNPFFEKKLNKIKNSIILEFCLSFLIVICFFDFALSLMKF